MRHRGPGDRREARNWARAWATGAPTPPRPITLTVPTSARAGARVVRGRAIAMCVVPVGHPHDHPVEPCPRRGEWDPEVFEDRFRAQREPGAARDEGDANI